MSDILDLAGTLSINTGGFMQGLAGASGSMKNFGSELLSKFGAKGLVTMGVAAGFAVLAKAAVDFVGSSVKVGMEFDKAMSQVAATQGTTMDKMEKKTETVKTSYGEFTGTLREFAQEMGSKTAFTATESAEALNYMALAGYDAKESMTMLPTVLDLAAAGNMELARASDMVTDAQSALGLSFKETSGYVDQMAVTASKANTSVEQLGDATLRIGGQARSLKGGTVELNAALGILADNGTKGAEAGTALRNVLLNIQGKKFEGVFGEMGVKAYDAEGNMRSLKDVFADLNGVLGKMSSEQRDKLIAEVFDRRSIKDVNALLGTSTTRWDELTAAISDSDGAAKEMAGTQLDNLQGDVTLAKSAFEGLQIAVSDKVTPALRGIVKTGSEIFSSISEGIKSGDIGGAIGSVLMSIGQKIVAFLPQIPPMALNLVTTLGKGLVTAIPNIIAGAAQLVQGLVAGLVKNAPKLLMAGLKLVITLGGALVKNIPKLLVSVVKLALSIPKGILKGAKGMFNSGTSLIKKVWGGIKSWFGTLLTNVGDKVKSIPKKVKEFVEDMYKAGVNLVKGLWNGIKDWWKNVKEGIQERTKGLGATTRKALGERSPSRVFREIGKNVSLGMAIGIEDGWSAVDDAMSGLDDIVQSGIDETGAMDMGYTDGTFTDNISIAMSDVVGDVMGQLVPYMQDGLADAMENVTITLDKRVFGKMSRKAVNGLI